MATITGGQTAKLLGVSSQAFASLVKRKRIKATRKDRHYILTHKNIENYITLRLSELEEEANRLNSILDKLK